MHDSHELDLPSIKAHVSSLHFIFIHVFTNTWRHSESKPIQSLRDRLYIVWCPDRAISKGVTECWKHCATAKWQRASDLLVT